jgi:hypothetical protein
LAYTIPENPKKIQIGSLGSIERDKEFVSGEIKIKGDLAEINN